jgi:catechol 2,3-dioxygenase-like lactoylglutathione lyase family enzyme
MINRVGNVTLFVRDQQRAKAFYTEKLGMELRMDAPLAPGSNARWVAVAPAGAATEIILYLMDENWSHYESAIGKSQAFTLDASDIHALCAELRSKGVQVEHDPETQPWGTYTFIVDSEGNRLLVVQQA